MIKLNDGCYVAASDISEITVNRSAYIVTVRMKNGISHNCDPKRDDIYALAAHIAQQIDDELRRNACPYRDDGK